MSGWECEAKHDAHRMGKILDPIAEAVHVHWPGPGLVPGPPSSSAQGHSSGSGLLWGPAEAASWAVGPPPPHIVLLMPDPDISSLRPQLFGLRFPLFSSSLYNGSTPWDLTLSGCRETQRHQAPASRCAEQNTETREGKGLVEGHTAS